MLGSSSAGPFFEVVFTLLVTELIIIALLTLPFEWMGLAGARAALVRWISTSRILASLTKPLLYFSVLVGLSFLFTTRDMLKLQNEYHEARGGDLAQKLQHESRMFRAQRNFYLTGFCMVLLLVIGRVYELLKKVNKLEATSEALRKQAEGAAAAYKAQVQELDEAKKKAKATEPKAGEGAKDGSGPAEADVGALQARLAEAEAARDAALKGAEALKKQAEGLSTEYARLQREKESLENKLADFEMVMGDEVKKAK